MPEALPKDELVTFLIRRLAALTRQNETEIGLETSLLDIGLQSIDAVLLCGEVEDAFQVEIDPALIFDHDTLGSFALAVKELMAA
ncbi:acyl carrier protein [Rhizobium sp. CSW-27]|uniref:acyl carrier protein n=1 Tax=Rhizobium sp. CSW-27 TaxID=2839985 RepID=UPI001C00E2F4|nr:acyl carrier protein [Rhizobium sp. CSW-27]MBT9373343.1 acyl carrier protein [Rhizobium sp. CSW-27]